MTTKAAEETPIEPETYPPEEPEHDDDDEVHDDPDEAYPSHGGGRRHRKAAHLPGQDIGHLNLVPMMDIMTMLLVFLVMSFATEPENINVTLSLRPPESTTEVLMEPATTITVTADMILVENEEIVPITDIVDPGKGSIPDVLAALIERAEHLRALEVRGGEPFDGRLLIVAHETTPYALITSVLVTAGEAQFSEYKLVLMQKGAMDQ